MTHQHIITLHGGPFDGQRIETLPAMSERVYLPVPTEVVYTPDSYWNPAPPSLKVATYLRDLRDPTKYNYLAP